MSFHPDPRFDEDREEQERITKAKKDSGFDPEANANQVIARLLREIAIMENAQDPEAFVSSFGSRNTVANHLKSLRSSLASYEASKGGRPELKINGQPINLAEATLQERRQAESSVTPNYELPKPRPGYIYTNAPGYSYNFEKPKASNTTETFKPSEPAPVPTTEAFDGLV